MLNVNEYSKHDVKPKYLSSESIKSASVVKSAVKKGNKGMSPTNLPAA